MRAGTAENGNPVPLEGFIPDRLIELSMDNFLSQEVLCLQGAWAKRRDAIKYIANVASRVHSGAAKNDVDRLLARLRTVASYTVVGDMAAINYNIAAVNQPEPPFRYTPNALDPVLLELLAAARFVADSPDVQRLESVVKAELESFS